MSPLFSQYHGGHSKVHIKLSEAQTTGPQKNLNNIQSTLSSHILNILFFNIEPTPTTHPTVMTSTTQTNTQINITSFNVNGLGH